MMSYKYYKHIAAIPILWIAILACSNNAEPSREETSPSQSNIAVKSNGEILFEAKCSSCHGTDGTAGIGNAANLQTSKIDSATITQTILNGKNGMPSFKNTLSDIEIKQLASYVQTLRR